MPMLHTVCWKSIPTYSFGLYSAIKQSLSVYGVSVSEKWVYVCCVCITAANAVKCSQVKNGILPHLSDAMTMTTSTMPHERKMRYVRPNRLASTAMAKPNFCGITFASLPTECVTRTWTYTLHDTRHTHEITGERRLREVKTKQNTYNNNNNNNKEHTSIIINSS